MEKTVRVLIVEDSEEDAQLILRELEKGGYKPSYRRVDSAKAMKKALGKQTWDVVIADLVLPGYSGLEALGDLQESGKDLPFIVVSGKAGEDAAVEALKLGVHDYVSKRNLARLVPSVEREMFDAHIRQERKRAEKLLIETNELLDKVFSNIYVLIAYLDRRLNFIRVNRTYAQNGGHDPEFFPGKNLFDLYPDNGYKKIFLHVLRSGKPYYTHAEPFLFDNHTRRKRYWDWNIQPVKHFNNRIEGLLLTLIDVTEHKLAEEALQREHAFRKAIEDSMPAGVVGFDPQGRQNYVNKAFTRMVGWSKEELMGKEAPFSYWPPEDAEINAAAFQRLMQGELPGGCELRFRRRRGEYFWALLVGSSLKDGRGKRIGHIVTINDITERKHMEEEVLHYQEQLRLLATNISITAEKERKRIAVGLHDHIGQLFSLMKIKLSLLEQELSCKDKVHRMLEEIRGLIDQAASDTRTLTFELCPPILYQLGLEAALEWLVRNKQQKYNIRCTFHDDETPKSLHEDTKVFLFHATRELILNAVKHSRSKEIAVSIRSVDQSVEIRVEDKGVGFDPSQLRNRSDKIQGFGLFNIRLRMESIGGRLEIVSRRGKGTKVALIVPQETE